MTTQNSDNWSPQAGSSPCKKEFLKLQSGGKVWCMVQLQRKGEKEEWRTRGNNKRGKENYMKEKKKEKEESKVRGKRKKKKGKMIERGN